MKTMKQRALVFFLLGYFNYCSASINTALPFSVDTQDKAALQRGARVYMNYCSGCHSLKYVRYTQMAKGLGLTSFSGEVDSDILIQNLMFAKARIHDPIQIAMPMKDAKQWFGMLPPDLSLIARSRGPAWVYTFLESYYADDKRPFHANNLLFPDVGMPDVLYPLRGEVRRIAPDANDQVTSIKLITVKPGTMTTEAFDQTLKDLVTFLVYVGEPVRDERKHMGVGVLMFLGVAFMLLRALKKSYWKRLT